MQTDETIQYHYFASTHFTLIKKGKMKDNVIIISGSIYILLAFMRMIAVLMTISTMTAKMALL